MAKIVRVKLLQEFKELFNPDWRNLVYYGGRGSGKSMHVAEGAAYTWQPIQTKDTLHKGNTKDY
jgi:phage terminase large subunit